MLIGLLIVQIILLLASVVFLLARRKSIQPGAWWSFMLRDVLWLALTLDQFGSLYQVDLIPPSPTIVIQFTIVCLLSYSLWNRYQLQKANELFRTKRETHFGQSTQAQQGAYLLHDTVTITDVNDTLCKILQCTREELIGRPILELLVEEDFKGLGRLRMRVLREQGYIPPVHYVFKRCNGSQFMGMGITEKIDNGKYRSTIVFESEDTHGE